MTRRNMMIKCYKGTMVGKVSYHDGRTFLYYPAPNVEQWYRFRLLLYLFINFHIPWPVMRLSSNVWIIWKYWLLCKTINHGLVSGYVWLLWHILGKYWMCYVGIKIDWMENSIISNDDFRTISMFIACFNIKRCFFFTVIVQMILHVKIFSAFVCNMTQTSRKFPSSMTTDLLTWRIFLLKLLKKECRSSAEVCNHLENHQPSPSQIQRG